MTEAEIHVHYQRPLTPAELMAVMKQAPDQVHWPPGQDGVTAYWFEVIARVGDNTLNASAFYVRADTPAAAQEHARTVGERFRAGVEAELRQLDAEGGTP